MAVRGVVTHLARSHDLSLISLVRPGEEDAVAEVAALGVEVIPVPFVDRRARGATRLKLTVRAAGHVEPGWADAVDGAWRHFLFERFKPYYESGAYKKR